MTDNFQSRSSRVGRSYEDQVVQYLTAKQFIITGRLVRHPSGVQFDITAIDPFGEEVAFECKASDDSAPETSRGMRRGDNRWKVLGYLYCLRLWRQQGNTAPRYYLITSDMPEPGSEQRRILDLAELVGDVTIMVLHYEAGS
jgi:hypothetical protein